MDAIFFVIMFGGWVQTWVQEISRWWGGRRALKHREYGSADSLQQRLRGRLGKSRCRCDLHVASLHESFYMPCLYGTAFFLELIYGAIAKLLAIDFLISSTAMQPLHAAKPAKRRVPLLPGPLYLMKLTVAAASVTILRQLVSRVCGDELQFMRIEHCAQTRQSHVCLCIAQSVAEPMMDAVALYLPDARIGTIREPKLRYLVRSHAE